ncbi:MFS transporter fmqE [Colletotrichum trifolii]|uniref:MFS transporter fmqE n=1 Tax=Colletotrichum trifolii TaxID=5466 RepID=A0A4R8RHC9_COLTR|nr:MFS transporter fmqE [Colletotrichum trifolii]
MDFGYEHEGSLMCGWLSDRFGRRLGLLFASCISILGIGLQYAASEPGLLLAGKMINGLASGFFLTLTPIYISEIAPQPLRPALTAAVNLFINAGQMTAIGIGNTRFSILSPSSYKVLFAAQWAFPCFLVLYTAVMPESPWFLLRNQREDAAKNEEEASAALALIQTAIAEENELLCLQEGATTWVICAEASSQRLRARMQGVAMFSNAIISWAMGFVTPYLINTDSANLGAKAAFVWAGLCISGGHQPGSFVNRRHDGGR